MEESLEEDFYQKNNIKNYCDDQYCSKLINSSDLPLNPSSFCHSLNSSSTSLLLHIPVTNHEKQELISKKPFPNQQIAVLLLSVLPEAIAGKENANSNK